MCPPRNFEKSLRLSNFAKLWTKDIAGSSKQWRKWGFKSRENPVPICISQDARLEHLLAGRYQVDWGFAVKQKVRRWWAVWGQVCYFWFCWRQSDRDIPTPEKKEEKKTNLCHEEASGGKTCYLKIPSYCLSYCDPVFAGNCKLHWNLQVRCWIL